MKTSETNYLFNAR